MPIIRTRLIPPPYHALQVGRFTFVRPDKAGDAGLLAHESCHGDEQQRTGVLRWWWRYAVDREFRVQAEARAYAVSMRHGMSIGQAVAWLLTYDDGLSKERARELLEAEYRRIA